MKRNVKFFVQNGGWPICLSFMGLMVYMSLAAPQGMGSLFHAIVWASIAAVGATTAYGLIPDGLETKPEPKMPDEIVATRKWVDEIVNAKTSNCMRVGGDTVSLITRRIERLERLNKQGGYLAFVDDKSVRELGFDYLCGAIHEGENGKYYRLVDVVLSNGFSGEIVSATIVPEGDVRYKANVDANYDHVCANYSGRGTEMCTEVGVSRELCEKLIKEYKGATN